MEKLSHLDSQGRARMVDVGSKPVTRRRAVASAFVRMAPATLETLLAGGLAKGDASAVARIAGIQGAKLTPTLIPLCHPLPLDQVAVELRTEALGIRVFVQARAEARTGVEMEALCGAAAAGLAVIDMVKGIDRGASIADLRVEIKEGGKSGRWARDDFVDPWVEGPPADPDREHR